MSVEDLMGKPRIMKSIYDFIYLDNDKICSYYAQLTDGLPNQKKISNKKGRTQGGKATAGPRDVVHGELDRHNSLEDSSETSYDMAHVLPRDMINLLDDYKLIAKKLAVNNLGKLVLVEGYIYFNDFELMSKATGPTLDFMENLQPDNKEVQNNAKAAKPLVNLLQAYPIRLQANVKIISGGSAQHAWMTLQEENLTSSTVDFSLRYESVSPEKFFILGILDALPEKFDNKDEAVIKEEFNNKLLASGIFNEAIMSMNGAFNTLLGRPKDFFGITPICIFRKIGVPHID